MRGRAARTPRHRVPRPVVVLAVAVVAVLAAAGCGVDTDSEPRPIPRDNVPEALLEEGQATTPTTAASGRPGERVEIYLTHQQEDSAQLVTVHRTVPQPASPHDVLDVLLGSRPTETELNAGYVNSIPTSTTQYRDPERLDNGALEVYLSNGIFSVEGDSLRLAFGQITCTLTADGTWTGVIFVVADRPVEAMGGSGQAVSGPVTCNDYSSLLPAG